MVIEDNASRELELAIRLSKREFEEGQRRERREEEMLERAIALSMTHK